MDGRPTRPTGGPSSASASRPTDQFRVHWQRIRRRWVVVLICVLLGAVGSAGWVLLRGVTYTGSAALAVQEVTAASTHRTPETDAILAAGYADYFNQPATQQQLRQHTDVPADVTFVAVPADAGPAVYVDATSTDPQVAQTAATAMAVALRDDVRRNLGVDQTDELNRQMRVAQARVASLPPGDPGRGGAIYRVTVIQSQIDDQETKTASNQLRDMQLVNGVTSNATGSVKIIAEFVLIGLVIGCVLAWALGRFARHLAGPDEIRTQLGLETVAVVAGPGRGKRAAGQQPSLAAVSNLVSVIDTSGVRTVVITSPRPSVATARIAESVAILRAQQGLRTLLVQADVERAAADHVTGSTGLGAMPGVTDFLAEGRSAHLDGKLADDGRGLLVAPPGSRVADAYQLFSRPGLAELLHAASGAADLVVVDAPSVIEAPETQVIASLADTTLVVLDHYGPAMTPAADAIRAVDELRHAHARLGGVVIARGDPSAGSGPVLTGPWQAHQGDVRV